MIKAWIITLSLLLASSTQAYTCEDIESLNDKQKDTLMRAFLYGYPHNMGYTLAAIVWRESGAGMWKINIQDPSAGIAHNHLKYSLIRLNRVDNSFNRNVLAQQLVDNDQLSLDLAIKELKYWYSRHKGNWGKTRASYNTGNNWASTKGKEYSEDIKERFKTFTRCDTFEGKLFWTNNEDFLEEMYNE